MPVAVIVGYDVSPFVDRNRHLHRMTCQASVTEPVSHFDPLVSDLDIFLSLPIVNSFPLPNSKKDVNDTNALLPKAFVKTSAKLKKVLIHANMMIPAAAASRTLW